MQHRPLTSHAVARLVSVSPSTVLAWLDRGLSPGYRTPGGQRRVERGALVRFLRDHAMPVPTELLDISRLLVIDHGPAFGRTVKRMLRRAAPHLDTRAAQGPVDGLVQVVTFCPDAILLDAQMPGIDGADLCKKFRSSPASAHIRVIGVAEQSSAGLERSYERAGAAGFLTKPIELGDLLAVLGLTDLKDSARRRSEERVRGSARTPRYQKNRDE